MEANFSEDNPMKAILCALVMVFSLSGIVWGSLEFPEDGRWSVATGWKDEWPDNWKHANPQTREVVGEWVIHTGEVSLPGGILLLRDSERILAGGMRELKRRWEWKGSDTIDTVTLSIRQQWRAVETRPFLPGISYYDNPAGQSVDATRIPVIGTGPGARGLYEEHRFPMPLASWEGKIHGGGYRIAAMHTLPSPVAAGNLNDQWWSLGVERLAEDKVELAVYSGAVASNGGTGIIKGKQKTFIPYPDAWCSMKPGQVIEKTVYLQESSAGQRGSGFQQAVQASLRLFNRRSVDGFTPYREILQLKMKDSAGRYRVGENFAGIDAFPGDKRPWIDLGWAGQSEAVAYPMILLGEAFAVKQAASIAQESLDFICTSPFTADGFSIRYDYARGEWFDRRNPLSQGQAMNNMLNALRVAREAGGFDTSKWEAFLRKACLQHADRILRPDWSPVSTNEGFLIAPLAQGAELLDLPRLEKAAIRAAEHYMQRHLSMDEPYWGGTLDARCEDKEGAWAALQGFLAVYQLTGDSRYLQAAEHAGDVILSYVYLWDVPMPPGRLADNSFRSRGWTSVSVQNMHLDVYGVLCAPAIWQLGDLTGRHDLKSIARLMTVPCGQLTDPWGSAGEQLHQTNYAQHYDFDHDQLRGVRGDYVENWNVYWITAHFLNAAAQFREMGVDCTDW